MNTHFYRIVLAFVLGLSLTAVFIANLAQANDLSGAGHIYCVVPTSTTPGPFAACDEVFQSVQAAVDTAVNHDEIWVAAGHYTDVHTTTYGSWSQVLFVTETLTIRGGYLPPFTSPPDPLVNPTILDAQGQATTVRLLTPETTLTGLHITGGSPFGIDVDYGEAITLTHNTIYNNGGHNGGIGVLIAHSQAVFNQNSVRDNLGGGTGGGLAIWRSEVTLDGNEIVGNVAQSRILNANDEAYGGGLWAEDSAITLTNNLILSNTAVLSATSNWYTYNGFGGGLAFINSQVFASDNEISHNTATRVGSGGAGGGLYSQNSPKLHLVGNNFSNNVGLATGGDSSQGIGGGLAIDLWSETAFTSSIILTDNLIQGNIAAVNGEGLGGGLYFSGDYDQAMPLSLHHNIFISNTGLISGVTGLGGGLFLNYAQANLSSNQIVSNTAAVSTPYVSFGGGIFVGGGQVLLNGDLILNNTAMLGMIASGGGIGVSWGDLAMTNTVLLHNKASSGAALATYAGPGQLTLNHSTIANNRGGNGSAIFVRDDPNNGSPRSFSLALTNTILVSHTIGISVTGSHTVTAAGLLWYNTPTPILAGPSAHISLTHEIVGQPRFAPDGYHLTDGSAAIRAGLPSAVPLDIDGEGRPFFPSLGVDEYWPSKSYLTFIIVP